MKSQIRCFGFRTLILLAAGMAAGCGGGATVESFTPKADAARDALSAALTAWQKGMPQPGTIEGSKPAIEVADTKWQSGAKLKTFEITQALPGDSPRMFSVKLTIDGASAPEEVVYVVAGKDPLWVCTKDQYERSAGM